MVNIRERVEEWSEKIKRIKVKKRDFFIPNTTDVKAIVGPRRAGKTYYLFQLFQEFMRDRDVLYLNLDDIFLLKASVEEWKTFFNSLDKETVLLLDEVQNLPNWGKWIRTLHDEMKFNIYITGSSSKLLLQEISTELRGRYISKLFLPLSFREFLKFKGRGTKEELLREYMQYGGFPEVVLEKEELNKVEKLKSIYLATFYRDFVDRYRIRESVLANFILEELLASTSSLISISRLHKKLLSQGIEVSKRTLWKYYELMKDSLLFFDVSAFVFSMHKRRIMPKKVYAFDLGIVGIIRNLPLGAKLEALVAQELLRKEKELFYLPCGEKEVDFVVKKGRCVDLIEVSVYADEDHRRKLLSSKKCIPPYFEVGNSTLISMDGSNFVSITDFLLQPLGDILGCP